MKKEDTAWLMYLLLATISVVCMIYALATMPGLP